MSLCAMRTAYKQRFVVSYTCGGAGDVLAWLVQSPVVNGSVQKWLNQLPPPLQQQLNPYMSRRKLLVSKLIGAEAPGGGLKGAICGAYCYGR